MLRRKHCSSPHTALQEHSTVTKTDPTEAASLVSFPALVHIPLEEAGPLPTSQGRHPPGPLSVQSPSPVPCPPPFTGDRMDSDASGGPSVLHTFIKGRFHPESYVCQALNKSSRKRN